MQKFTLDDPTIRSADVVADNLETLKDLFPDAFTEGKIDFEVLKQLLGGAVDERDEKYGLNWHGKRAARQLALSPSTGTLRPCPAKSVDWDTTQNLMIEGDNLEVLKLLQKSYSGKVKLIYIDPPYNTGNDFVYPDTFSNGVENYLQITGQTDEESRPITSNPESSGRYHTDWLSMMYPRLYLARSLLRPDGLILASIDDAESANLRTILDDIFGSENFIATFVRRRRLATGMRGNPVSPDHEYVLAFAKNLREVKLFGTAKNIDDFPLSDSIGRYRSTDLTVGMTRDMRPNQFYPLVNPRSGTAYLPSENRVWRFEPSTMAKHVSDDRIIWPEDDPRGNMSRPRYKTRFDPTQVNPVSTWIESKDGLDLNGAVDSLVAELNQAATKEVRDLLGSQVLEYPKPVSLIKALCALGSEGSDIVLDFFAGSGTTGQAVWEINAQDCGNRRFIVVQLPEPVEKSGFESIAAITEERLRRAGEQIPPSAEGPVDTGFRVFELSSSNIEAWEPDRDDLGGSLLTAIQHLKGDRSEQDILFELVLKLGLELTVPVETRGISGKAISSVGAGTLITCLAESLGSADIEPVGLEIVHWHKQLDPAGESTVIFRDSAFQDDVSKTNLTAILEQHGITTVRSL